MSVYIPKAMKMTPEHRILVDALSYLSAMYKSYAELYGSETSLAQYYGNGHDALYHHVYENFLK